MPCTCWSSHVSWEWCQEDLHTTPQSGYLCSYFYPCTACRGPGIITSIWQEVQHKILCELWDMLWVVFHDLTSWIISGKNEKNWKKLQDEKIKYVHEWAVLQLRNNLVHNILHQIWCACSHHFCTSHILILTYLAISWQPWEQSQSKLIWIIPAILLAAEAEKYKMLFHSSK